MERFSRNLLPRLAPALPLLIILACARPPAGPYLLHPMPPQTEHFSLERGAVVFTGPGFNVALRPLDWRFVGQCYADAGMVMPFGSDETASRFLFFSLRFENDSTSSLFYNPRRTGLRAGGATLRTPIEVSDVYRLDTGGGGLEERARSFVKTSFDGSEEIPPGTVTERYLVFRAPRDRAGSVEVLLEDLYLGSESVDLVFVFETFPAGDPGS